ARIQADAVADAAQQSGDAGAEGDFSTAEAGQAATSLGSMAQTLNTPWATSEAGLAGAKAAAAAAQAADLLQYAQALGAAETAYAAGDASHYKAMVQSIDAVWKTDANAAADSGQTLVEVQAADEATFELADAAAWQAYQNAQA